MARCTKGDASYGAAQEHEASLKAFQRALHLAPNFTYAVTLAGHEYFANEDLEKSTHCYQAAIRLDRRHYNAWCGSPAVENDCGSQVGFDLFWLVLMGVYGVLKPVSVPPRIRAASDSSNAPARWSMRAAGMVWARSSSGRRSITWLSFILSRA